MCQKDALFLKYKTPRHNSLLKGNKTNIYRFLSRGLLILYVHDQHTNRDIAPKDDDYDDVDDDDDDDDDSHTRKDTTRENTR